MISHLVGLLKHLDRERYEPYVIAPPENNLLESLDRLNVTLYQLEIGDKPEPGRDIRTSLQLRSVLRKAKPDLLHVHGHKAALIAVLARVFQKDRCPMVVSVHNYPSYHGSNLAVRKLGSLFMRLIVRKACKCITVSDAVRRGLVETDRVDASRTVTIHNGIETERNVSDDREDNVERLKEDLGVSEEMIVIGAAGRLIRDKGHSVLLKAADGLKEAYPGIRVLIAGDGPDRTRLEDEVTNLRLRQTVALPGFIGDLRHFFGLLDVFVLASLKEAFGIVLLEAMRSGCPVVASDAGGIPEIVRDGETGLLFPAGDTDALAAAVGRLLDDKRLRDELARNAKRTVKEEFSLEKMAQQTMEVYDGCL